MSNHINAPQAEIRRGKPRKRNPIDLKTLRDKSRPTAWLRSLISPIDFGVKVRKIGPMMEVVSKPVHCNTNAEILDAFRSGDWHRIERLSNRKLDQHWSGEATHYFVADGSSMNRLILVNIDLDCHASGSPDGAFEAAEYLKANFFPGLYHEPSTNEEGRHGYFVLDKSDLVAESVKRRLKELERRLNEHLLAQGFDIEMCEIKGLPPVITWGDDGISNYTAGILAKIPRQVHRFEEWKRTTVLDEFGLGRLCKKLGTPTPPKVSTSEVAMPTEAKTSRRKVTGSISGRLVGEEELAQVAENGLYRKVATTLTETHVLETSGRSVVTAEDVAIFLLCLKFFTGRMNADGTLPLRRFEGLWAGLYGAGDVGRSFDCHRFKAIRDYLSDLGLIDWEDKTYVVPRFDESGMKKAGRACKWKAGSVLMEMLDRDDWADCGRADLVESVGESGGIVEEMEGGRERAPFVGTVHPTPPASARREGWAAGEAIEFMTTPLIQPSLRHDTLRDMIQSLTPVTDDRRIRPIEAAEFKPWRLSPEEVTRLIPDFEVSFRLLAA